MTFVIKTFKVALRALLKQKVGLDKQNKNIAKHGIQETFDAPFTSTVDDPALEGAYKAAA